MAKSASDEVLAAPLMYAFIIVATAQYGIGNRDGADGVVGEGTSFTNQLKVVIVRRIELESTSDNVADDCA